MFIRLASNVIANLGNSTNHNPFNPFRCLDKGNRSYLIISVWNIQDNGRSFLRSELKPKVVPSPTGLLF